MGDGNALNAGASVMTKHPESLLQRASWLGEENSSRSGESCYDHFVLDVDKGPACASPIPTHVLSVCCVLKSTSLHTDVMIPILTGAWVELFRPGLVVKFWLASDPQTFFLLVFVCLNVFCLHVCLCNKCLQCPEARRWQLIFWN